MFDLNEISSNIILIGFVIVGILCLYLLYSNFQKSKQIQELQTRVEDIKNIFINQQRHNDETHAKLMNIMQNTNPNSTNPDYLTKEKLDALNTEVIATKKININPNITNSQLLIQNMDIKDIDDVIVINENPDFNNDNRNSKEINIDLHDLDNMSDAHSNNSMNELNMDIDEGIEDEKDNSDVEIENITFENNDIEELTDANMFDIRHAMKKDDDNESIATEQMISDADLNDIMNEEINLEEVNVVEDVNNDLDNDDLDNLDLDLDDINNFKQVNLNDTATLEETIVNNITSDDSTKTITFGSENSNNDDTETIELDKLLSGDVKKIEITKDLKNKDNSTNDINSMSLKQLKEHAKNLKIKTTGLSKQELITAITSATASN